MNHSIRQTSGATPVIRGQAIPVTSDAIQVRVPSCDASEQPVVKVNKENDIVRSIEIHCACGHTVQLVCDYTSDSEATA